MNVLAYIGILRLRAAEGRHNIAAEYCISATVEATPYYRRHVYRHVTHYAMVIYNTEADTLAGLPPLMYAIDVNS